MKKKIKRARVKTGLMQIGPPTGLSALVPTARMLNTRAAAAAAGCFSLCFLKFPDAATPPAR